jgi:hypothetical protein
MEKPVYNIRTYRNHLSSHGLMTFQVTVRETDLYIAADHDLSGSARDAVFYYRSHIENYI